MSIVLPPGFSHFLATLRTLPMWVLAGMTLVCLGLLYAPQFGGINPGEFRAASGPYLWAGCIAFGLLGAARASDLMISRVLAKRERERKVFLVAVEGQGWWGATRQPDGTYVTQIRASLTATNLMSGSLVIVNARLVRPGRSHEVLQTMALVSSLRGYSSRNVIPGERMGDLSVTILLRGTWQRAGRPVRATIGVMDQYGSEHRVKVTLKPFPQPR
jgi:hypothetical protein